VLRPTQTREANKILESVSEGPVVKSLVEELQRSVEPLNGVPRRRLTVGIAIAYVYPYGVKHHVLVSSVRGIMYPDVNESLFPIARTDPQLPKNDRAVRDGPHPYLYQVALDGEVHELMIGQAGGPNPHPGLVLVPVPSALYDLGLDLVLEDSESLDRKGLWLVGVVEWDLFC